MRVDDVRSINILDGLTEKQLEELVACGTEIAVEPGVELFHEGGPADSWFLLVDGTIELVRHDGREEMVVGQMDVPGRWSGGFRAWDEHAVYLATGRGKVRGRVLCVPSKELRQRSDAWFPFGGHLIAGLYGTARRIESMARQRDSLVTLGTLAAGLAHEINNPAAAASRAVDALEDACGTLLSSLGQLAEGEISAQQFVALDRLRREIVPHAVVADPLVISDLEDELAQWLTGHGVVQGWAVATPLAVAGVDLAWCERAASILEGSALESGLAWVASTMLTTTLLAELKDSTTRISELVNAVRSYSQMDRAAMQNIDVTEGLESTLIMLGHKLRDGITIERDYGEDLPQIDAFAGELNQVWTNLIDNAIDAMDGRGVLRIVARVEVNDLVIEICDSGPGMPHTVAVRAFEAFYSTKDVGSGTGLGLDIARRIVVERHAGAIDIDSNPGAMIMRVTLPIRHG